MMKPGIWELVIVLVIVLLLFGPGRLSKIAGELGSGIRNFRDGISEGKEGENEEDEKTESEE
ncbi:MAG: twin-arginine translocase TatA/TatE family subunit [Anaerolineae bacterium]|nr:twin-arginine translocase TatA/TatE family subunit [Anaerolineae bacterium]MBT7782019.1 twin-arginine translocase TatA/TatE family subunit [Anaerolineae bacterium]